MSQAGSMLPMVGGIVSSVVTADATDRAYQKLTSALDQQQTLAPSEAAAESSQGDITKYQAGFAAQNKYDPVLAQLRSAGATDLVNVLQDDAKKNQEDSVLNTLVSENVPADAKRNAVRDLLLDKAKENLDSGATLSPTYQAELIRAGLSSGAGGGIPTAAGPAGVQARELIGVQGEQLKQQRQAAAQSEASTVSAMDTARSSILNSLIPSLENVQNQRMSRAAQGYGLGNAAVPSIGMTGNDLVNLHLKNIATQNSIIMQKGQLGAEKSMLDAGTTNDMIGQGMSLGTSMMPKSAGGGGGGY